MSERTPRHILLSDVELDVLESAIRQLRAAVPLELAVTDESTLEVIVAALADAGRPMRRSELYNPCRPASQSTVGRALDLGLQRGELVKATYGYYALPPGGEAANE
jgi:hypothetical protein